MGEKGGRKAEEIDVSMNSCSKRRGKRSEPWTHGNKDLKMKLTQIKFKKEI